MLQRRFSWCGSRKYTQINYAPDDLALPKTASMKVLSNGCVCGLPVAALPRVGKTSPERYVSIREISEELDVSTFTRTFGGTCKGHLAILS